MKYTLALKPISIVLLAVLIIPRTLAGQEAALAPAGSLAQWLTQPAATRPELTGQPFARLPLSRIQAHTAQDMLWHDRLTTLRETRREEWDSRIISLDGHTLKYEYKTFGEKPAAGWSLYISLHGGGGAPAALNDQQWHNQIGLYQPAEGIYLAPRAPTNDWDLWHKPHIDAFLDRLIENAIVLGDVNPNRVYLMGYSAGGDGVYQLAGRMADRWAAASMMAGHPNDASPLGLRNIGFSLWVGALDSAYNRNRVGREWGDQLDQLRRDDPQGYPHSIHIQDGMGHWMNRSDSAALPWMAQFDRDPFPAKVVWKQDDVTHARFYWLAVAADRQKNGSLVVAVCKEQRIDIEKADGIDRLTIFLNDRLLDLDRPVTIVWAGRQVWQERIPRTLAAIAQSLARRNDPTSVYTAQVEVIRPD